MTSTLDASYACCRRVARQRARNFYYSFRLLDRARRDAMCAIYAFMRECDDLSDEPAAGDARAALARWRADLDTALSGGHPDHPLWPAFCDTVARYRIPHHIFYDLIEGVTGDLEPRRMATFEELRRYCYQVASVPGLCVIYILGHQSPEAPRLAEACGIAFQLTNILRDVKEDAGRDRIYLPAEDLDRFGVQAKDLLSGTPSPGFVELMRFEAQRAYALYRESMPLLDLVESSGRPMLWALITIYSRLLERIEQSGFDVLRRRIRLSALEKTWIMARSALGAGRA
jgi:15-cis-phytoene synthase